MKKLTYWISALALLAVLNNVLADSDNGGAMQAYYDGQLFTINFKELSSNAEEALIAHNGSINFIYMSDQAVDLGFNFISVIDAIQGDGFNPLWVEVQITFNVAPYQLLSDDDITDAVGAGDITLTTTDEVYRCSVIGSKK